MRDYRKLEIWKLGREIVKKIYPVTSKFPRSELFSLVDQMKRAAVSIVSNIAEGCAADSNKEFIRYLRISMGSVKELETHLYVASDVGYLEEKEFDFIMEQLDKLSKKLWKYIEYLKNEGGNGK